MAHRVGVGLLLALALAVGCTTGGKGGKAATKEPADRFPPGLAASQVADCFGTPPDVAEPATPTPAFIARSSFDCALEGGVLASDVEDRLVGTVAAGLAARLGVPLFSSPEDLNEQVFAREDRTFSLQYASGRADRTEEHPHFRVLGAESPVGFAEALRAITHDTVVWLVEPDDMLAALRHVARSRGILLPVGSATEPVRRQLEAAGFTAQDFSAVLDDPARPDLAPASPGVDVWLTAEPAAPSLPLLVLAALGREQRLVHIEGDPRTSSLLLDLLEELGDGPMSIRYDPAVPWEPWQLATVLSGLELPGGGFTLFPGRRIVALYGHPRFGGLGVLGEQEPGAAVDRARQVAAPYEEGGLPVVPAFDIITTLASAGPTADGDYSEPLDPDVLRPWIEAATDAGFYVTLDFQPGRSSYIDQVPRYEEFLLLPNVGVALDPEWRLGPNQVHLEQIGSTSAAEINDVADYLSRLVRDHALPQKLLVVHQFRLDMIRDRELLATPQELAVVIHMDGQGAIATKNETYRAITAGFADRVWWGWKNFYDEDSPTPSPEHTVTREPAPVFVSYQ